MDDDFVRQVYEASYRRLVGQLYGVCRDLGEAEDVVQEAFAQAIQHERKFRRTDNPEAWLRTVAVNLSRSRWRRRIVGDRLHRRTHRSELVEPDLSPDHVVLIEAMRQLPEVQRQVIALHHLADLPVNEVAQAVGAPVGTVKARLSRGRAALAELLSEREEASHA
ncbi:MAG TPA: SigE family RNA polymerase sigma factor [Nocardioidaceae bacterium]|nr:SigE family RNA polymerase sigma factor [Nocardioidaceae bacterium]